MLTLRSSPTSPFVRKVRIAASVLGLEREIAIEPADTMNASDTVRQQNPLGKIPALVLEDGTVLFDSRVILDYLDHRAGGGRIVPSDAGARFAALRLQALADGLMDASVLSVYEGRFRPAERHEPKWLDHQSGKVNRALAALEAAPPALSAPPDREAAWLEHCAAHADGHARDCRLLPGIAGASRRRLDPRPDANESPGRDVRGSFRLRVIARQNRTFAPARKMLVVKDTLPPGASAQLSPQLKLPRST